MEDKNPGAYLQQSTYNDLLWTKKLLKCFFSTAVKHAFKNVRVMCNTLICFSSHSASQKTNIFLPLKFPVDLIQRPATEIRLEIAAGEMVRERGRGRVSWGGGRGISWPRLTRAVLHHQQLVQGHVPVVLLTPHSLEHYLKSSTLQGRSDLCIPRRETGATSFQISTFMCLWLFKYIIRSPCKVSK